MPQAFDPYYTWLGIPPEEQPPDHYRLLGLRPFEQNVDVIENAADQRMTHLRTLQTGSRAKLSQKLLNEVAAARVCLLNPDRKAAYDRQLRQLLRPQAADAAKPPRVAAKPPRRKTLAEELRGAAGERPAGSAGRATAQSAHGTVATSLGELGEYRLLEKLGEGGMGAVYRALHTKLGREVALKVLPKGRIDDSRAIARFEREMMAVGAVDHPNIVRAMDAREIEGTRFLVMEFVKGLDLAKVIRRLGPLPVPDACELARQAAIALQCAHEHKLIHRDVKPSNLMLTPQGQVKLLDLGLARFQSDQPIGEEVTATGQPVGTVDYMAPEQVSDTHTVDIRADVYSLGCTLYKLLCGRAPFSGPNYETHFNKMQGHLQKPVPPIRQFRRDVPKELIAVVNRMLAKEPGDRFATPADVADAIGPMATASDLPGLLARAEGQPTAVAQLGEALTATEEVPSSSALTRFFQQLKSDSHPPVGVAAQSRRPLAAPEDRRARRAIIIGCVAVGVLSVAILIVAAVKLGRKSAKAPAAAPATTGMVFDWPPEEREGTRLFIDDKRLESPALGPLVVPRKPGKYRIRATRDGFKPNERVVTVAAGRRQKVPPFTTWIPEATPAPQGHVVIKWREDERNDAALEIDGTVRDLSDPAIELAPDHVKVLLPAGPHKLWIIRRGVLPFGRDFTIVDGEDQIVDVVWSSPTPGQEKHPVPSQAEQQAAAKRIEERHGPAAAGTAEQQAELAGQRLRQGSSAEDPAEQFVLFRQAVTLAAQGGDAAVLIEAVGAMGDHFKVDPAAKKQEALAEFVRTATPLPEIRSPDAADKFADSAAGSPRIAALSEAVGQVAVGDAYWDLSQTQKAESQEALMLCAARWYRKAQPAVTSGTAKDKYKSRLAQIAQVEAGVQEAREVSGKDDAYGKALGPAEKMVAAWDFRGAAAALAKLEFRDRDLAARLAGRRDDVKRLVDLKTKMIAKINTAQPRLRRSTLKLRGRDADLVKADEDGITAKPGAGSNEPHPWKSLNRESLQRFLPRVIDSQNADDRLAAGLLALVVKDATSAQRHFEQARSLGASIDRYLDVLAAIDFKRVNGLLDEKGFREAKGLLNDLEKKYGQTAWYGSHQHELEAARERIRAGMASIAEAEGEKLYADAVKLFKRGRYFELKPLVLKLRDDYPNTPMATDPDRKPSFAEMQAVIDNLGKSIAVRQDGRGDFRTIQEAIRAAPPNSVIEVQDNGAYSEEIVIPVNKSGLTLRGGAGFWPIVTTAGLKTAPQFVVTVRAERSTIERLVLVNPNKPAHCVFIEAGSLRLHWAIVCATRFCLVGGGEHRCEMDNCVTVGAAQQMHTVVAKDCVLLKGGFMGFSFDLSNVVASRVHATGPSNVKSCTIPGPVRFEAEPNTLLDSIASQVESVKPGTRIENCNVYTSNGYKVLAEAGKGCISDDPKFRNANSLDFRLAPKSPCRKKASDGGDLGCRHTPEMMELLNLTFELRRRGIITIPAGG